MGRGVRDMCGRNRQDTRLEGQRHNTLDKASCLWVVSRGWLIKAVCGPTPSPPGGSSSLIYLRLCLALDT